MNQLLYRFNFYFDKYFNYKLNKHNRLYYNIERDA